MTVPSSDSADQNEAVFSVNPYPSSTGPGNPITLAEGEAPPKPEDLITPFNNQVNLDKESYENGSSSWAEDAIKELEAKRAAAAAAVDSADPVAPTQAAAAVSQLDRAAPVTASADADTAPVTATATTTTASSDPVTTSNSGPTPLPSAQDDSVQEQQFSVAPIAASSGNRPPSVVGIAAANRDLTVSKEDYDNSRDVRAEEEMARIEAARAAATDAKEERSDEALAAAAAAAEPAPVTTSPPAAAAEEERAGETVTALPVPDSKLLPTGPIQRDAINPVFIQSAGPETSTAALAADAPIRPREPAIVVSKADESAPVEAGTGGGEAVTAPSSSSAAGAAPATPGADSHPAAPQDPDVPAPAAKTAADPDRLSEAAARSAETGSKKSEDRASATSSDKDKKKNRRRSMLGWLKNLIQH